MRRVVSLQVINVESEHKLSGYKNNVRQERNIKNKTNAKRGRQDKGN